MSKILLVCPSIFPEDETGTKDMEEDQSVPLGVLNIATFLKKHNYDVKLIDARLYPKNKVLDMIDKELDDTILFGISATTPQVKHGLQLTDYVKNRKNIPVVWGGTHAILYPEQTCEDKNIDYVIYGEGEYNILDLVEYIMGKKDSLKNILGLVYKKGGKIIKNKLNLPLDVKKLPMVDYDLLDTDKYINRHFTNDFRKIRKVRTLDIMTSRGCPYQCTFCTDVLDAFKKWRAIDLKILLPFIENIIRKYNLNHIYIKDDFFFGDLSRVKKVANFLSKFNVTWEASLRADCFDRMDDNFLKFLKDSGCICLRMGIESGSDRILKLIKKDITVDQIVRAIKKCREYDIVPFATFMCGFPFETRDEIKETANLIIKLKEIMPYALFCAPGPLRPYPGTDLYKECVKNGFEDANSLREWSERETIINVDTDPKTITWIKDIKWILDYIILLRIKQMIIRKNFLKEKIPIYIKLVGKLVDFRFNHDFFKFMLESKLARIFKKI